MVADMLDHGIDGLHYIGTPERAAAVARSLADRGFAGPRFLETYLATASFLSAAGSAAEGWQVMASHIAPDAEPVRDFASAHRKRYGSAPAVWAAEAYDVTRLLIDRLTALAAKSGRRPSRAQVTEALKKAEFKGLVTTYAFEKHGRLRTPRFHHQRVDGGRFAHVRSVSLEEYLGTKGNG
ncbi:ABC transporter substrate-binding protein [Streptomyces sp. NPDC013978]|uniref:ABC transporter substrate-binding protein n=1 Tax=Streptomyces sp. NPDC013978 TaxID=3364869 RepID=UPI0036F76FAA